MSVADTLSDNDIAVRDALPDDVEAISSLYAWHVLNGRASFEETPPTIDEMRRRMRTVAQQWLPLAQPRRRHSSLATFLPLACYQMSKPKSPLIVKSI